MKRVVVYIMIFLTIVYFCACNQTGGNSASESEKSDNLENSVNGSSAEQSSNASSATPKPIERPYIPFERTSLLSDELPLLCKPKLSGDFIQPWLCANWNAAQWENHCKLLKKVGFEFVILQCTTAKKDKKYTEFYYPSQMANNPLFSVDGCKIYPNCLKNALDTARKIGMKIMIGVGDNSNEWWECKFRDKNWYTNEANAINRSVKEIYDLYYKDYADVFMGWYWSPEMYTSKSDNEIFWSEMLSLTLDYMTKLDSSIPCMISPFISSYEDASLSRIEQQYTYFFEHTRFRKGDIFAPQDGIGVLAKDYIANNSESDTSKSENRPYSLEFCEKIMKIYKSTVALNHNVLFWYNVEIYGGANNGGAPLNRVVDQMELDAKFATKLITFSYSHYYHPSVKASKLNNQYFSYIKWLEQNTD